MIRSALGGTILGGKSAAIGGARQTLPRLLASKSNFLVQTFAMLLAQIAVTAAVAWSVAKSEGLTKMVSEVRGLLALSFLVLVVCAVFIPMTLPVKAALFTAFSAIVGVMLFPLAKVDPQLLFNTMGAVSSVFAAMFALGVMASLGGANLALLGVFLYIGIVSAAVWRFAAVGENRPGRSADRFVRSFLVGVFALYVLFDTWYILRRDYEGDYATAAMDYYFDVINLFLKMIQLAINRK